MEMRYVNEHDGGIMLVEQIGGYREVSYDVLFG